MRSGRIGAGDGARRAATPVFAVCLASLLAGCASQTPVRTAGYGGVDPKYGVRASPRVVADGEPVPKGGGQNMVGKPYTIAGRVYYPSERMYSQVGLASWYGSDFHGRRTANGEVFDLGSISAAHPTMPLPSYARVTNLRNHASIIVRVNDRGPYHANRVMDVSQRVAEALDFRRSGTARVRVDFVGRASLAGSDDTKLMATLRTDGRPAALGGDASAPVMVAREERPEPARVAALVPAPAPAPAVDPEPDAPEPAAAPAPRAETPHAAPKAAAPLPPSRPLDLGTIPGAGAPIAAPVKAAAPRKPPQSIQALLQDDALPAPPRR